MQGRKNDLRLVIVKYSKVFFVIRCYQIGELDFFLLCLEFSVILIWLAQKVFCLDREKQQGEFVFSFGLYVLYYFVCVVEVGYLMFVFILGRFEFYFDLVVFF